MEFERSDDGRYTIWDCAYAIDHINGNRNDNRPENIHKVQSPWFALNTRGTLNQCVRRMPAPQWRMAVTILPYGVNPNET